ncbi:MAG: hypothetical protein ACREB8_03280 [Pseudolabrys sp.]
MACRTSRRGHYNCTFTGNIVRHRSADGYSESPIVAAGLLIQRHAKSIAASFTPNETVCLRAASSIIINSHLRHTLKFGIQRHEFVSVNDKPREAQSGGGGAGAITVRSED